MVGATLLVASMAIVVWTFVAQWNAWPRTESWADLPRAGGVQAGRDRVTVTCLSGVKRMARRASLPSAIRSARARVALALARRVVIQSGTGE
jgi:hypothetical protein